MVSANGTGARVSVPSDTLAAFDCRTLLHHLRCGTFYAQRGIPTQTVRNRKDRARRELAADDPLDDLVVLGVDCRRRFVQDEDLAPPQERASQAHELALARRQVGATPVGSHVSAASNDERCRPKTHSKCCNLNVTYSLTWASRPPSIVSTCSLRRACSRAFHNSSSGDSPSGSRFCRIVPARDRPR